MSTPARKDNVMRRTKIVATLGPSSDRPGLLKHLLLAGVDVCRLNFSHGSADDHRRRAQEVRNIARDIGRTVAILADLQGPKIRIARFRDGSVNSKPAISSCWMLNLTPTMGIRRGSGSTTDNSPRTAHRATFCCLTMAGWCFAWSVSTGYRWLQR